MSDVLKLLAATTVALVGATLAGAAMLGWAYVIWLMIGGPPVG